ncbi:hypothetical protein OL548_22310 [Lysinibacillus sp. MHQ-1]|nr:hypothetical protein OL548_22310 [Lysinibacillus sp. MHQ-1]
MLLPTVPCAMKEQKKLTVLLALLTASISFGLDKRRKGNFVNS